MSDPNKRSFRRRSLSIDFKVFDSDTGELVGRLGDFTPEGMLVWGERAVELKRRYRLRVEFPDTDGSMKSHVFEADAMWGGPDRNPEFLATGFRFVESSDPETARVIFDMINRFCAGTVFA